MNGVSDNMTRDEITAARKAKKAEAKLKKQAATAAKKEQKDDQNDQKQVQQQQQKPTAQQNQKQQGQQQTQKQQKPQNQQQKNQPQQQKPQQSALKKEEPTSGPKQVRFDLTLSDSEEVSVASTAKSSPSVEVSTASVHPAFLKLAAACDARRLVGVDAICVQFMQAFEEFITSYEHNQERKVSDDLNQAKEKILSWLSTFYYENFEAADSAISQFTMEKIQSRRRLLTYSWCPLVERAIIDAAEKFGDLEVTIIDSPADRSAKKMLNNLADRGIKIRYGVLDAIGYVIKDVDVVLLGCTAILSNGYAVSARGSSLVALTAQAFNIPVLIAAKTYKFVDKASLRNCNSALNGIYLQVQTFDKSVREKTALMGEKYETIPDDLITALVTDLRILPASSAPAVLRAKQLAIV
ncbi:hypothetical protein QR680_017182 [Steinernema hermaphroditum]|uniref:Translation initiation factor eIF2B subunit delta n=1 Tax=Steinernema hermaphroditum TaxID=289476 RepID=A0AA39HFT8_9BILA|nr:hypothetical protein QR680_017182 [Steinernema hermaphroditum]